FATAFVVRCSRGLELEPRSKLHLERSSRVVVEQELSKCSGVRRFVCQAQEVYVRRPDKAAFWIVGHRAEVCDLASRQLDVVPVEEIEKLNGDKQPPRFAEAEALLRSQIDEVKRFISEGVPLKWNPRRQVRPVRTAAVFVCVRAHRRIHRA